MRIMHNTSALNAHRLYTFNNSKLSKSLEKLSSGYAINRAGDNAAGLAVSEKMRAQIAGLEQASKNAQDGISMVQTYEGALTETDSILQRMRSLAVQSANGTYDNSVDRVAIEQEFKQLNDELDQIADTDFNGVIVLNGGVMADGLKAEDGVFDYKNKAAQDAAAQAAEPVDIFKATNATTGNKRFNTVDDTGYTNDTAEQLWEDANLTDTSTSIDVTFKVKSVDKDTGAVTYEAVSAVTNDEKNVDVSNFTPTGVNGDADTSGHGGFTFNAGGTNNVNVIFDATDLKAGDTITLTLDGPGAKSVAPKNAGVVDGTVTTDLTATANPSVKVGDITDELMTEDIKKIYDALNGKTIEGTVAKDATKASTVKLDGTALTIADDGSATIGGVKVKTAVADGVLTISTMDDKKIADIDFGAYTAPTDADKTVSFKMAFDEYSAVPASAKPNVVAKASEEIPDAEGVSKSNALGQASSKLTYNDGMSLQVGARTKDLVDFTFAYDAESIGTLEADLNCTSTGLGTKTLSLATQESANEAIDKIDHAINKVSMVRGTFGAIQNRLEHKINNLDTNNENLTAAESRIRDTDMAKEMMEFTKNQILSQASQSMLAQANQLPQGVLSLLQ